jgi:hypothetical protein
LPVTFRLAADGRDGSMMAFATFNVPLSASREISTEVSAPDDGRLGLGSIRGGS